MNNRIGVVAIGRNEGDRLEACLESLTGRVSHLVYVDSGSTDGSQQRATVTGRRGVQLDCAEPFTAARRAMLGAATLLQQVPSLELCSVSRRRLQLVPGWLAGGDGCHGSRARKR